MEYLYLVDLNSYISDEEIKINESCNCVLSNKNILAISNDCCVYILPIEKPNELIPVHLSNSPCVRLVWSDDGQYLLNVYKNGQCNLFNVKTTLLNTIELVYSFELKKSDISAIKSFSKSPKLSFNYEKRDSHNNLEKFSHKSFNFLKSYGKFSYNGFLILTKSGSLHVLLTDHNSVKTKYEKFEYNLNLVKNQSEEDKPAGFDLGDFSFETDGSINVAFTDFDISSPINIYKVQLKFSNDGSSVEGTNELLASINLPNDEMTEKINFLFTNNEMAQNFCVALRSNKTNCDIIQVWQPSQLNKNLIGAFEMDTSNEQCTLIKSISCPSSLTKIVVPKCAIAFRDLADNRTAVEAVYIVVSYQNGTIGLIDTQNYNQKFTSAIPMNNQESNKNVSQILVCKKMRFSQEYLINIDQSFSGSLVFGITNFCRLVAIRQASSIKELSSQNQISHLMDMYEYCLFSGYDYWDLLMNTPPKQVDGLIEKFEDKYLNEMSYQYQRVYFNNYHSLLFSFYRKSPTWHQSKPLDILIKLILNRSIQTASFSIQLILSIDSINSSLPSNKPGQLNTSILLSNLDSINQSLNNNTQLAQSILNQVQLKNNLDEYLNDLLKLKTVLNNNELKPSLNEMVQSVINRKNYQLVCNQQLKHIFQWIIDTSLHIISVVAISKLNSSNQSNKPSNYLLGSSLINDNWFLNEIRKGLIYIKLLFSYSSINQQQQQQSNNFISTSLPILPLKSSSQKDILSEMFNIFTKLSNRLDKTTERIELNEDTLIEQCLSINNEIITSQLNDNLVNLKNCWLGSNLWNKPLQFRVNHLFDEELNKKQYPLFDIIRLIQFSISSNTKQCIRCGNYTESNTNNNINNANNNNSKINCLLMQDSCGERCICGGMWVSSDLNLN